MIFLYSPVALLYFPGSRLYSIPIGILMGSRTISDWDFVRNESGVLAVFCQDLCQIPLEFLWDLEQFRIGILSEIKSRILEGLGFPDRLGLPDIIDWDIWTGIPVRLGISLGIPSRVYREAHIFIPVESHLGSHWDSTRIPVPELPGIPYFYPGRIPRGSHRDSTGIPTCFFSWAVHVHIVKEAPITQEPCLMTDLHFTNNFLFFKNFFMSVWCKNLPFTRTMLILIKISRTILKKVTQGTSL